MIVAWSSTLDASAKQSIHLEAVYRWKLHSESYALGVSRVSLKLYYNKRIISLRRSEESAVHAHMSYVSVAIN